jgi:hypothetical protein
MTTPNEFDWVTARVECSTMVVIARLTASAERSIRVINSDPSAKRSGSVNFKRLEGGFWASGGGHTVLVSRHGSQIRAEPSWGDPAIYAAVILNEEGSCRLVVEGVELKEWQFLRRLLEPLFFPEG